MLAHAFLTVATAIERDTAPTPAGLITLTVNEFRRLFDALLLVSHHSMDSSGLVKMASTPPVPSPTFPLPTAPESMIPVYGSSINPDGFGAGRVSAGRGVG